MDVLIALVIFYSLAGLFVFAAAAWLIYKILLYRDEYKALRQRVRKLEHENLRLTRVNEALRDFAHKGA